MGMIKVSFGNESVEFGITSLPNKKHKVLVAKDQPNGLIVLASFKNLESEQIFEGILDFIVDSYERYISKIKIPIYQNKNLETR